MSNMVVADGYVITVSPETPLKRAPISLRRRVKLFIAAALVVLVWRDIVRVLMYPFIVGGTTVATVNCLYGAPSQTRSVFPIERTSVFPPPPARQWYDAPGKFGADWDSALVQIHIFFAHDGRGYVAYGKSLKVLGIGLTGDNSPMLPPIDCSPMRKKD